ncbi:putative dep domain containing protein [Fasciolopsis buskii]|uniref:Putative dep domain containing protein n=1 Tax=Fasciolopsis buskii TaxID=27845 RepID=A0A8E0RS36_9TREM|nr:putative dep domain containing protein [Fasciolopsis buski]
MTAHSSHSAANLTNMVSVSGSLSKLSDSMPPTGTGTSSAGPQPIPFPESFVPRATSGPNGSVVDFETEWLEIAFATNALSTEHKSGLTPSPSQHDSSVVTDRNTEFLFTVSHGSNGADKADSICHPIFFLIPYALEDDSVLRKSCICDLDDATVGDRAEWTHCVYDTMYHPLCAFTLELQWLVASGSRLAELISQWHHRARNNLHFFPIPCFPFEYPGRRSFSDPLRHPIFVPCRLDRLTSTSNNSGSNQDLINQNSLSIGDIADQLFGDFPEEIRLHMVRLFQDHLLRPFGFLPSAHDSCQVPPVTPLHECLQKPGLPKRWTYVHCSGGMFVMIPVYRSQAMGSRHATHESPVSTASSNLSCASGPEASHF